MKRLLFLALAVCAAALIGFSAVSSGSALAAAGDTSALGRGGPGRGDKPADGTRAGGQVSAVSGTTISVTKPDGTTKSILTTSATTFEVNGASATLAAVQSGMYLHAEGTTDASGAFTASKVVASTEQPQRGPGRGDKPADGTRAGGEVSAVSGTTISVTGRDGTAKSILTTSATTFTVDGASATLAEVTVGMHLHAEGSTDASGAFTASKVSASTEQPQRGPGRGERGPAPTATPTNG
jgi:hypothetical protein